MRRLKQPAKRIRSRSGARKPKQATTPRTLEIVQAIEVHDLSTDVIKQQIMLDILARSLEIANVEFQSANEDAIMWREMYIAQIQEKVASLDLLIPAIDSAKEQYAFLFRLYMHANERIVMLDRANKNAHKDASVYREFWHQEQRDSYAKALRFNKLIKRLNAIERTSFMLGAPAWIKAEDLQKAITA